MNDEFTTGLEALMRVLAELRGEVFVIRHALTELIASSSPEALGRVTEKLRSLAVAADAENTQGSTSTVGEEELMHTINVAARNMGKSIAAVIGERLSSKTTG